MTIEPMTVHASPEICERVDIGLRLIHNAALPDSRQDERLQIPSDIENETLRYLVDHSVDSVFFRSIGQANPFKPIYDLIWEYQKREIQKIVQELLNADIEPVVFKGAELVDRFFGSDPLSTHADFDLLIHRSKIDTAREALLSLGYNHAHYDRESNSFRNATPEQIACYERNHYEIFPLKKKVVLDLDPETCNLVRANFENDCVYPLFVVDRRVVIIIECDLHHGVLIGFDSDGFFDRLQQSVFEGASTLSDEDHLWFNVVRYYFEICSSNISPRLRQLIYSSVYLKRCNINWDLVFSIETGTKFNPALYYILYFLNEVLFDVVPESVFRHLDPRTSHRDLDFGWQVGKLLNRVSPFPYECVPLRHTTYDMHQERSR